MLVKYGLVVGAMHLRTHLESAQCNLLQQDDGSNARVEVDDAVLINDDAGSASLNSWARAWRTALWQD